MSPETKPYSAVVVEASSFFIAVPVGHAAKISITGLKFPLPVTLKNCVVAAAVKEYQTSS